MQLSSLGVALIIVVFMLLSIAGICLVMLLWPRSFAQLKLHYVCSPSEPGKGTWQLEDLNGPAIAWHDPGDREGSQILTVHRQGEFAFNSRSRTAWQVLMWRLEATGDEPGNYGTSVITLPKRMATTLIADARKPGLRPSI